MGVLLVSVEGLVLTQQDCARLSHPLMAGVVLFARNYESREQLLALTTEIKGCNSDLSILVDQEGGRIQRFTDDFTKIPAPSTWGALFDHDSASAKEKMQAAVHLLFSDLHDCGVEISLVPCLDIDYGHNTVIGNRAFSGNKDAVFELGNAYVDCMHEIGVPSVGKHFPGHGYVALDSHIESPVDSRAWAEIKEADAEPFIRLLEKLDMLMPAHILYPAIDERPVTFSKHWIQEVLRDELGYAGVIVTDCLSMKAAAAECPDPVERVNAALSAGCDWVTFCNSDSMIDEIIERSAEVDAQTEASVLRCETLKAIYFAGMANS